MARERKKGGGGRREGSRDPEGGKEEGRDPGRWRFIGREGSLAILTPTPTGVGNKYCGPQRFQVLPY